MIKSEIRYISFINSIGKWRVIAPINGKRKNLGTFNTLEEAKNRLIENGFEIEKKNGNIKFPNKYVKHDDYYSIIITRSDNSEIEVKIDLDDYDKCVKFNWYADISDRSIYIKANNHNRLDDYGDNILIHRYLMNANNNCDYTIDHISTNTLDNRRHNLRKANQNQQVYNQKISTRNTSGVKNVSYVKPRNMWRVRFQIKGIIVFEELFNSKDKAIEVANKMRKNLHGEFEFRGDNNG